MRFHHSDGTGRPLHALALAGLLTLALAACGGTATGATTTTDPAGTAPASMTPVEPAATAESTPGSTTVQVDGEAWFAGFHLTFGTATAELTAGRGGTVTIETVFENTGDEDARLDATLNLASAGENAREAMAMDIPRSPGGLSANGVLAFDVEDTFTFDDAVLTLGQLRQPAGGRPAHGPGRPGRLPGPRRGQRVGLRAGGRSPDRPRRRRAARGLAVEARPDGGGLARPHAALLGDLRLRLRRRVRVRGRERRPATAGRHHRRRHPGRAQPVDRAHRAQRHGQDLFSRFGSTIRRPEIRVPRPQLRRAEDEIPFTID